MQEQGFAARGEPVAVHGSRQFDVRSEKTGRCYRILCAAPSGVPPAQGYPVIYLLDGHAAFCTVAEAVARQSRRPEVTGVSPAIVIGIAHYGEDSAVGEGNADRRIFDYTPEAGTSALGRRADGSDWPPVGGAEAFLSFIADELKPTIARDFPTDPSRQILFGHSLGGLFTLYALFNRSDAFSGFIAASPSIWFGERVILQAAQMFADRLQTCPRCGLRLMIGIGGAEERLSAAERELPNGAQRAAWLTKNRMIANARELAERMQRLEATGLRVAYAELPDENHASVVPALVSRALRFALAPAHHILS